MQFDPFANGVGGDNFDNYKPAPPRMRILWRDHYADRLILHRRNGRRQLSGYASNSVSIKPLSVIRFIAPPWRCRDGSAGFRNHRRTPISRWVTPPEIRCVGISGVGLV